MAARPPTGGRWALCSAEEGMGGARGPLGPSRPSARAARLRGANAGRARAPARRAWRVGSPRLACGRRASRGRRPSPGGPPGQGWVPGCERAASGRRTCCTGAASACAPGLRASGVERAGGVSGKVRACRPFVSRCSFTAVVVIGDLEADEIGGAEGRAVRRREQHERRVEAVQRVVLPRAGAHAIADLQAKVANQVEREPKRPRCGVRRW
eukprot:171394-Prymnesium_polylepis.1